MQKKYKSIKKLKIKIIKKKERKKIQKNLQNKPKHKNNKCFP